MLLGGGKKKVEKKEENMVEANGAGSQSQETSNESLPNEQRASEGKMSQEQNATAKDETESQTKAGKKVPDLNSMERDGASAPPQSDKPPPSFDEIMLADKVEQ